MDKNAQLPIIYLLSKMCKLVTVRLDRSNYISWFFQLETMLQGLDLMSYVDGSCPSPPLFSNSMTTAFAKEFQEWNKIDKAVLSLISATICGEALSYLVGSSSSREAWLRLRDKYSAVSSCAVMQLKTDLHTLRKSADSVDMYLQRVKGIRDQLAFVGVHYTDEDIIFLALEGLPREYNNIKVVVRAMDKSISMQKFQSLLLDAKRDFEKQMVHQIQSPMFAHTESAHSFNGKSSSVGNYCNNSSVGTCNIKHENLSDNGTFRGTLTYRNFRNNGNQSFGNKKKRDNGGRKYDKSVSSNYNTEANVIPECQICRKRGHTAAICYWRNVNTSDSIVHCQFCGKRGHIALNCHHRPTYTFLGPKPSFTLAAMTAHGGSPYGTFPFVDGSSDDKPLVPYCHTSNGAFPPRNNFIGTHIGVSPAVVDEGEHIMINDDKADLYVVVGNDNCVSTNPDEDLFWVSQNGLEKVVDDVKKVVNDVKSFNSEDDQLCDGQQQLEKSGDDNSSVITDSDEDMIVERRPQLKKLVDSCNSEYDEDLLDCSRSLWKSKCVTTNEFHRYPYKRIGHVCGDDCYEFSDEKKASENIDINEDTVQTAKVIAIECELLSSDSVPFKSNLIEGRVFHVLSDRQREEIVEKISVTGRSSPNDKLLLMQALKEHVVVTEDSTNDAYPLDEFDIGLVMGIQVMKVVSWGHVAYANLQKLIQLHLTIKVVTLAINVVAISSGDVPVNGVQLLWVSFIMDTLGALSLATEFTMDHLMNKPIVGGRESLITNIPWRNILIQVLAQLLCLSHLQVLKIEGSQGTLLSDLSLLRSIVGALKYSSFSRPDILLAVNLVCRFLTAATYVTSAKRMLRTVISTCSNLSLVTHAEIEGRC